MSQNTPAMALDFLADRYWNFLCEETPLAAVLAGCDVATDYIFRESLDDHRRRYDFAAALTSAVAAIEPDKLDFSRRISLELLESELHDFKLSFELDAHFRPSLLPAGPDFHTISFANSTVIDSREAAERYVARLGKLPIYINSIAENLLLGAKHGYAQPKRVLALAAENARRSISGPAVESAWMAPFKRSLLVQRGIVKSMSQTALETIENDLYHAIAGFADLAMHELAPSGRDTIACIDSPMGEEYYVSQVGHFTSVNATPEELHRLGLEEVARLDDEMTRAAKRAGYPSVEALRVKLSDNEYFLSPSPEALLIEVRNLAKQIDQVIPSYFGRLPRSTYGVKLIPPAQASALPAAFAQLAPSDGSAAGIFWISSLTQKAPKYLLPALALHEAWPGHLMHTALIQELEELPAFRRYGALRHAAYIEGWALYCEGLGDEMGFYEDPYLDFGRLDMEMFRAARLVVDTGIHWYRWSREKAIDFMLSKLSFPLQMVEGEVDRYIALPGQALAYQVGNLHLRKFRRRAEETLGENFNLRRFHEAVMAAGPVTLPLLEKIVDAWLGAAGAAVERSGVNANAN